MLVFCSYSNKKNWGKKKKEKKKEALKQYA
jgi:hypothetical protein